MGTEAYADEASSGAEDLDLGVARRPVETALRPAAARVAGDHDPEYVPGFALNRSSPRHVGAEMAVWLKPGGTSAGSASPAPRW